MGITEAYDSVPPAGNSDRDIDEERIALHPRISIVHTKHILRTLTFLFSSLL
jgi:hypothetical protein